MFRVVEAAVKPVAGSQWTCNTCNLGMRPVPKMVSIFFIVIQFYIQEYRAGDKLVRWNQETAVKKEIFQLHALA